MSDPTTLANLTRFIYETGMLANTPRSGLWFLGTGKQSVAEHTLRTAYISYVLAYLTPEANRDRMIIMSLFHDLGEARTSDLNYVHQKYGRLDEARGLDDLALTLPFGDELNSLYKESVAKETLEAQLVKDADQLEWIATLREEEVKGNSKATSWLKPSAKRIKTDAGKQILHYLLSIHPDDWWYSESDTWFVDRKKVSVDPEVVNKAITEAQAEEAIGGAAAYTQAYESLVVPAPAATHGPSSFRPMAGIIEDKAKKLFSQAPRRQEVENSDNSYPQDLREEVIDPNFDFDSPTVEIESLD